MLLQNKTIIITGSTTGIGAGIARLAIEQGARVMIHGRDEERAKKLVKELGDHTHYVIAELTDPHSAQTIIDHTIDYFGHFDGLVNNAGIYPRNNINTATPADFDYVMAINVKLPLFLAQRAIAHFHLHSIKGSIVNIGSINAYCGQDDLLIYSMSKGALMTMTRNLAEAEGHRGVRINQLNVGWTVTETELATKSKEGLPADWPQQVPKTYAPSGTLLTPNTVAPHAVFWLSDYSAPSNGQVYEVEQYPVIGRNLINYIGKER